MTGFSTIVSGTAVSPLRLNYDITVSTSNTVALTYSGKGITDKVGLQVVIWNNSGAIVTLTAVQFDNYQSYSNICPTQSQCRIYPNQTVTLITTVVGQEYTIGAISNLVNIDKGAAGSLIYQTAPNRTGFLAAGTSGYILLSGGAGSPPFWNLLSTGNLTGGVAGSLLYQSAPSTTEKSAAGTAFTASGGGIAAMTSSTTAGWSTLSFAGALTQSTLSGSTLTLKAPKARTYYATSINPYGNLYAFLGAAGVTLYDGDIITIVNNLPGNANFVMTIRDTFNPNSWSPTFLTSLSPGNNQITLFPNESVTLQSYNSTNLTIVSTTQCQQWTGMFTGTYPGSTAAGSVPYVATYDPKNWLQNGGKNITPTVPGYYYVCVSYSISNITSPQQHFGIQKNGNSNYLAFNYTNVATNTNANTVTMSAVVQMNGTTDYININALAFPSSSSNFLTGPASTLTVSLIS